MPRIRQREPRPQTRGRTISTSIRAGLASIREVCLIGPPAPVRSLSDGDRVGWSGRGYRVRALDGGQAVPCYAHVTVVDPPRR
jgi:hypothetical protein